MVDYPAAVSASAVSDTGRVREHNEDAVWLGTRFFRDALGSARFDGEETDGLVLAVADGVGGAAAGEIASRQVVEAMAARITEAGPAVANARAYHRVAEAVNGELLSSARRDLRRRGMATTYTGLHIAAGHITWLNAGDSRLYHLGDSGVVQITRDHTLREESGDPSIPGNIITNCFGTADGFYIDVGNTLEPIAGDRDAGRDAILLLCSDGLSDYADMQAVSERLMRLRNELNDEATGDPNIVLDLLEEASRFLLGLALEGGGGDNVTAMVVVLHA